MSEDVFSYFLKSSIIKVKCHCGKVFNARKADIDRGWAKSCSKSCAAKLRESKEHFTRSEITPLATKIDDTVFKSLHKFGKL